MLSALRCSLLSHLGRRVVGCASVNFSAARSAVSPIILHSQCRQRGAHSSAPAAAAQGKFSDAETSSAGPGSLPLAAFYSLCDVALNSIQNRLEMPDLNIPTFESELTSGALSVKVEGVGNWVLNRQTPNRQIWLASSLSGPKRYDFDPESKQWVYARDQSKLKDLLESELSAATKLSIRFDEHF